MGKKSNQPKPAGSKPAKNVVKSEGISVVHVGVATTIALLCVIAVQRGGMPPSKLEVVSSSTSNGLEWLAAPTQADEGIENDVLTVPIEPRVSRDGYEVYPPQRGLHVLKQMGNGTFLLWRDANAADPAISVQITAKSMRGLRHQLEPHLNLGKVKPQLKHLKQPWQLFGARGELTGQRLDKIQDVMEERLFVAIEGGQWIWPGVKVGHKQPVPGLSVSGRQVMLETLSLSPLVMSIEGFLAHKECDFIVENGKDYVQASPVALMDKDKGKPATEWRTSSQTWLSPNQLPAGIKERTAQLLRVPVQHQEQSVQFLKYGKGQKYDAHHDYFDMAFYSAQPQVVENYDHGYKNRLSTVFWYLNDVAEGGHTQFPRAGGKHQPHDFATCQGLTVKPSKGKVILFYSLLPSGNYDYFSLHGGCPVLGHKDAVKWAANQWTWNKPF